MDNRAIDTIDFSGGTVAYVRRGAGDPIVFLHNGGSTHRIWTPQLEHFAATHDVIGADLLGFGESRLADGAPQSLDSHVDALDALIEQLGLDGVTVVGNCMGSATSLAYAQRRPERVRGVFALNVLTDATIGPGVFGGLARVGARWPRAAELIGRTPLPAPLRKLVVRAQLADGGAAPEIVAELSDRWRDRRNLANLAAVTPHMGSYDGRRPTGGPPVHVAWGARNLVLPLRAGRKLMQTLRPDRFTVVEGAGHLAMLDKPAEITRLIEDLLAQTATATPELAAT